MSDTNKPLHSSLSPFSASDLVEMLIQKSLLRLAFLGIHFASFVGTFIGFKLLLPEWGTYGPLIAAAAVQILYMVASTASRRHKAAIPVVLLLATASMAGTYVAFFEQRAGDELLASQDEAEVMAETAAEQRDQKFADDVERAVSSAQIQVIKPIEDQLEQLAEDTASAQWDANAELTGIGRRIAKKGAKWEEADRRGSFAQAKTARLVARRDEATAHFVWVREGQTAEEIYARLLTTPGKLAAMNLVVPTVETPAPAEQITGVSAALAKGTVDVADLIRRSLKALKERDIDALLAAWASVLLDLLALFAGLTLKLQTSAAVERLRTRNHRTSFVQKLRATRLLRKGVAKDLRDACLPKKIRIEVLEVALRMEPTDVLSLLAKAKTSAEGHLVWQTEGLTEHQLLLLQILEDAGLRLPIEAGQLDTIELNGAFKADLRHTLRSVLLSNDSSAKALPLLAELKQRRFPKRAQA